MGILCTVNSITTAKFFTSKECTMKNSVLYKHPLAIENTKILIVRLNSQHTLLMLSCRVLHTRDVESPSRTLVFGLRFTVSNTRSSTVLGARVTCSWQRGTSVIFPVISGVYH
jgi:hypothetical protein